MTDANSISSLDAAGRLIIKSRDRAIVQWDQIISGIRTYGPWERILAKVPELSASHREAIQSVLPHIVDTVFYCFLAELDASDSVKLMAATVDGVEHDVAFESSNLPAEPCGENGWLVRFAKQRFEQPD
jgi:hypothetical protein